MEEEKPEEKAREYKNIPIDELKADLDFVEHDLSHDTDQDHRRERLRIIVNIREEINIRKQEKPIK